MQRQSLTVDHEVRSVGFHSGGEGGVFVARKEHFLNDTHAQQHSSHGEYTNGNKEPHDLSPPRMYA